MLFTDQIVNFRTTGNICLFMHRVMLSRSTVGEQTQCRVNVDERGVDLARGGTPVHLFLRNDQLVLRIIHIMSPLILASASRMRRQLLENAGLSIEVVTPRVDEEMIREGMLAEHHTPRDIADALAEAKATRISCKRPGAMVLGCDQVLNLDGTLISKAATADLARAQLLAMRGRRHDLLSAAVICQDAVPIWRHIGTARLTVRDFSDVWLDGYIARNWPDISDSVGSYKLEAEGVRLFSRIEGDYFTILGLPLLDLLTFLTQRGDLAA